MDVTATEFKNRVGQYMDLAETAPVIVQKSGKPKSVLISHSMYERFLEMENQNWLKQAHPHDYGDYVGEKAATYKRKEPLKPNFERKLGSAKGEVVIRPGFKNLPEEFKEYLA